ncbi:MAG: hypothetical protein WCJ29_03765 [bacterium]
MLKRGQLLTIFLKGLLKATVAIGFSSLVIWFAAGQISKISASIAQQRRLAYLSEKRSELAASLRASLKDTDSFVTSLKGPLIKPEDSLEFLSTLESFANQNSMTQNVRFGSPIALTAPNIALPVASVDYTNEMTGTWQTLSRYLNQIESARYYSAINSISLNASTEKGLNGLTNIVISGKVYVSQE